MKLRVQSGIRKLMLGGVAFLALASAASAQVTDQMGAFVPAPRNPRMQQRNPLQQEQTPPAASVPTQPQGGSMTTPPSLLDKPAQPAKVDLAQGQLSIHADNSSLMDIMHRLTADGGMTVDGLNKDQRVFGTYGPGDPQEIISELLDGMGYNVVMLGRTESGTPKQVTLTPRTGGTPNGPGGMRPQPMNQASQDSDEDDEPPQPQPMIANPVVETPQQPAPQPGGGVRTPQQMLQELQQMRQQQMQQMQQQQGQPQPPPPQQQ
ncbi:MAG TPA: hypothetical protein VK670_10830 [Silvibacterium sp.]|nr:hypothetical protein [Silvibacterium sp.]